MGTIKIFPGLRCWGMVLTKQPMGGAIEQELGLTVGDGAGLAQGLGTTLEDG